MIISLDQLDLSRLYTYADYLTWSLKERIELIKGNIFRIGPAPSRRHQEIVVALTVLFGQYFKGKTGKLFTAPFDVRLPASPDVEQADTVVQPDLCIVCDLRKLDERGCNGAPDLVVEILSPGNSRYEMDRKFDLYQEAGVREYWLVNPDEKTVLVYVLDPTGRYAGLKPFVEDSVITPTLFPELSISLREVFAE